MGKTEEDLNGLKLGFLKTVQPSNSFSKLIAAAGVKHAYCAKFMLTVSHIGNPKKNNIIEMNYTKTKLEPNFQVTERARCTTFALSIVEISLLQQYK